MFFEIGFYLCDTSGFLRIMYIIKLLLNLIRFVIPIILIVMTTLDLFKNVINPEEKYGVKKIINRTLAAVIIFLVPSLINLVLRLFDYIFDNNDTNYQLSSCYTNANMECIKNIESYLKCDDITDEAEKKECENFRGCNNYTLSNSCYITTELDDLNCSSINENEEKYLKFYQNNYKKTS